MEIHKMELYDLEEISKNLYSDFDDFWNYNIFKSELLNKNSQYILAKENNEIVGFAGFTILVDEADITNIVTRKDMRNKGIATNLLNNLITLAKSINLKSLNLEVAESNINAISLYIKCGFRQCGMRKQYYNNTENAILMKLEL